MVRSWKPANTSCSRSPWTSDKILEFGAALTVSHDDELQPGPGRGDQGCRLDQKSQTLLGAQVRHRAHYDPAAFPVRIRGSLSRVKRKVYAFVYGADQGRRYSPGDQLAVNRLGNRDNAIDAPGVLEARDGTFPEWKVHSPEHNPGPDRNEP